MLAQHSLLNRVTNVPHVNPFLLAFIGAVSTISHLLPPFGRLFGHRGSEKHETLPCRGASKCDVPAGWRFRLHLNKYCVPCFLDHGSFGISKILNEAPAHMKFYEFDTRCPSSERGHLNAGQWLCPRGCSCLVVALRAPASRTPATCCTSTPAGDPPPGPITHPTLHFPTLLVS